MSITILDPKRDWITIRSGDYVLYDGKWREVYRVTEDDGLLLEGCLWVCATKVTGYIGGHGNNVSVCMNINAYS